MFNIILRVKRRTFWAPRFISAVQKYGNFLEHARKKSFFFAFTPYFYKKRCSKPAFCKLPAVFLRPF